MSQAIAGVPQPGELLLGKYRVDKVVGVGGMGVVVAATHLHLADRFAIKFLLPESAKNPDIVRRFMREGQAATRIRSEHVARVFDVGTLENGSPYLVMEYLDGQDLAYTLQKVGPLAIGVAVDHLLQACEAIAEAHTLGIIHRDLKPSNLFVTRRPDGSPSVKVLDFGISKITTPGQEDMGLTKTSAVMGSPRYMSPEQMRSSRTVDARSDVWALGAILHELLVGRPAFNAETMTELCAQILQDVVPPLRQLRADVPEGVEAAVQRCLQKDPAARFEHIGELAHALAEHGSPQARHSAERITRVLQSAGISTSVARPASVAPSAPVARTGTSFAGTGSRERRNGGLFLALAGGAIFVVLAISVGVFLKMRGRDREHAGAASPSPPVERVEAPPVKEPPKVMEVPPPPQPAAEAPKDAGAPLRPRPNLPAPPRTISSAPPPPPPPPAPHKPLFDDRH
jgi:serine/threonine-protein kinase